METIMQLLRRALLLVLILILASLLPQAGTAQIFAWRHVFGGPGFAVAINPLSPHSVYAETFTGNLYASYDLGATWNFRGSVGINSIREILINPNDTLTILCVGEDNVGLRRTTDGGSTWATVLSPFGIDGESVTFDPVHPDTLYAGNFAGGEVFKSTDRGGTWVQLGTLGSLLCAMAVRPDSTNIILAGNGGGISKSTNSGLSWKTVRTSAGEIPKIEINASNPMIAYATINGVYHDSTSYVLKTTDGGENWNFMPIFTHAAWSLAIDQSHPDTVYTGIFDAAPADVFRTTDGGSTWSLITSPILQKTYSWNLKVSPLDPSAVWMACGDFGDLSGGTYRWMGTQTGYRGAVVDLQSNDTITNGFIRVPFYNDSMYLPGTHGRYEVGHFPGDVNAPYLHIESYPYPITEVNLSFITDSIIDQPIYLQKLATSTIAGSVYDSLTHHPLHATARLFITTLNGLIVPTAITDSAGHYSFDSLYVSAPSIVRYDSLRVDPEFPYAGSTVKNFSLTPSGLYFNTGHNYGDILLVQASGSTDYTSYIGAAVDHAGFTFATWNTNASGLPPLSSASQFNKKLVVYYSGDKHTPMLTGEADSLQACLKAGCTLLITGQDILELNDSLPFFKNVLGIRYGGAGFQTVRSRADEIFGDQTFFMNYYINSAADQTSPDRIAIPNLASNVQVLIGNGGSGTSGIAAVRIAPIGTNNKVIVMGFGIEGVNTPEAREFLIQQSLNDLLTPSNAFALGVTTPGGGWNLVSAPLRLKYPGILSSHPLAKSKLFSYEGAYVQCDTFVSGKGYWLRIDTTEQTVVLGQLVSSDTIPVHPGWNIIGSISEAVATGSILSLPDTMATSSYYGYTPGGYFIQDTIIPGSAVWVKVNQTGSLILSSAPAQQRQEYRRRMVVNDLPPSPPSEPGSHQQQMPSTFLLAQNYPNPFNPTTSFRFALPAANHATLTVYDLLGRMVATIVDKDLNPGDYSVFWTPGNIPSGVYFYRLKAGTFSETKRLLLLR
ncbi:MAG TPA: T9SS type A sorting domain-containing protein [Bacteroidota bacterium]|jgi:photosystem II stability/assembly factor-like uncharacterized protein|nr:T9SS type A sorting domain-containing protein [Bacteroidota bacterium]